MFVEGGFLEMVLQVPNFDCFIGASTGYFLAIRTETHTQHLTLVSLKVSFLRLSLEVPDFNGVIGTSTS